MRRRCTDTCMDRVRADTHEALRRFVALNTVDHVAEAMAADLAHMRAMDEPHQIQGLMAHGYRASDIVAHLDIAKQRLQ